MTDLLTFAEQSFVVRQPIAWRSPNDRLPFAEQSADVRKSSDCRSTKEVE